MTNDVFVIVEYFKNKISDVTFEMLGKVRELADGLGGKLVSVLLGNGAKDLAAQLGTANSVLYVDDPALAQFSPEAFRRVVTSLVKERQPKLLLMANTSMGMDLAAPLSAELNLPLVAYCKSLSLDGDSLSAISQLYGGKIEVESGLESDQAIVAVLAGSFPADRGRSGAPPQVEEVKPSVSFNDLKVKFKGLIEPEAGDVDISKEEKLVSIGRGIQNQENIEIAQELATALGAAISASRPIIDSGWLPKSRQVGKSGMTVKPKLYLALGISGAPEHLEGMKDADTIIAVNSDAKAPIFDIAHYGFVGDLFDFVPTFTEKVKAAKG